MAWSEKNAVSDGMVGKTSKADLTEANIDREPSNAKEVHGLINAVFEEIKGAILAGKTVAVEDHGVASFRPGRELKTAAWSVRPDAP